MPRHLSGQNRYSAHAAPFALERECRQRRTAHRVPARNGSLTQGDAAFCADGAVAPIDASYAAARRARGVAVDPRRLPQMDSRAVQKLDPRPRLPLVVWPPKGEVKFCTGKN